MASRVLCHRCGSDDVLVYQSEKTAMCPSCCDDHDYFYCSDTSEYCCEHCGKPAPDDYYDGQFDDP